MNTDKVSIAIQITLLISAAIGITNSLLFGGGQVSWLWLVTIIFLAFANLLRASRM